jgi:WD40-like Beta Propeller Repeat
MERLVREGWFARSSTHSSASVRRRTFHETMTELARLTCCGNLSIVVVVRPVSGVSPRVEVAPTFLKTRMCSGASRLRIGQLLPFSRMWSSRALASEARHGTLFDNATHPCMSALPPSFDTVTSGVSSNAPKTWMWAVLVLGAGCGRIGYERLSGDTDAAVVDASLGQSASSDQPTTSSDSQFSQNGSTSGIMTPPPADVTTGGYSTTAEPAFASTSDASAPDSDVPSNSPVTASDISSRDPTVADAGLDASATEEATTEGASKSDSSDGNSSLVFTSGPTVSSAVSSSASIDSSGLACADTVRDCGGACAPCPCIWGTPEQLGDPNYAGNDLYSPTPSADGLTLWFGLMVAGGPEQAAYATRATVDEPFGQGVLSQAPVSSNGWDGNPHLSHNQRSLYFYSARTNNDLGIYQATRATPSDAFDQVVELTTVNSTSTEQLPWVSSDERTIYFVSDRAGSRDIWTASRAQVTDAFSMPTPVVELNSTGDDAKLTMSPDGLVAIFASERPGGLGSLDLYRAARATTAVPFEAPTPITELSTAQADYDPELTRNGDTLYFASMRSGDDSTIWRVSVTCQ